MAVQSDSCDLARIEARWRHKIGLREAGMAEALAGWKGPTARLEFEELGADWEAAIRSCYGELGLELTPEALASMHRVMAASEVGHHHAHAEQLARFAEAG
jgi:hypothetical protein